MLVTLIVAKRRNYRVFLPYKGMVLKVSVETIPSLMLIVIIVGGIVQGILQLLKPQPLLLSIRCY